MSQPAGNETGLFQIQQRFLELLLNPHIFGNLPRAERTILARSLLMSVDAY